MEVKQLAALSDEQIRDLAWYYQIELRPGAVTGGRSRGSLSLTRSQIDAMEIAGQSCLDIGTQEGVISTLLSNRGTRHVVAYDRLDLTDRIELVKEAYGAEFEYIHSRELHELPGELAARGDGPPQNPKTPLIINCGIINCLTSAKMQLDLNKDFYMPDYEGEVSKKIIHSFLFRKV